MHYRGVSLVTFTAHTHAHKHVSKATVTACVQHVVELAYSSCAGEGMSVATVVAYVIHAVHNTTE